MNIAAGAIDPLWFFKEFFMNLEEVENSNIDDSVSELSLSKTAETSDKISITPEFAIADVLAIDDAINSMAYSRCLVFLGDIG